MNVYTTKTDMRNRISSLIREGKSIGFVPTMGFLHEGHLSLVEHARKENEIVVMSIFVNPAQFGPTEDFDTYPRDFERDAKMAETAGVDIIFHPSAEEMYPFDGGIQIIAGNQSKALCGASRPGHFDGVLKVIAKLFHIVSPSRAYFGMKDAQQLAIVETFVRDYDFPVEIRRVPIVREGDGVAKSSRNVRLTDLERQEAPIIYQALSKGMEEYLTTQDVQKTIHVVAAKIEENSSGKIDYVSLLDYPSLQPANEDTEQVLLATAVYFEKVRLIDNIIMSTKKG
ncbi:pantoate--beta-alanine ligase [Chungangia koreensis]|uniref:Pantothenate synthetase n=1 Tax=Chungangia koreensis TaxID=752657 RepID=A0ABV8X732_9LACT